MLITLAMAIDSKYRWCEVWYSFGPPMNPLLRSCSHGCVVVHVEVPREAVQCSTESIEFLDR